MAVETRPARASRTVAEIARLVAAIAAYHESLDERARFDWEEIRQAPTWLQTVLARDHHALWVADAGDGHLVGYLWVRLMRDHQGYLPRVRGYVNHAYLEENWRGKGLIEADARSGLRMVSIQGRDRGDAAGAASQLARSSAWYKLGYEDWTHERRLELKPRRKK